MGLFHLSLICHYHFNVCSWAELGIDLLRGRGLRFCSACQSAVVTSQSCGQPMPTPPNPQTSMCCDSQLMSVQERQFWKCQCVQLSVRSYLLTEFLFLLSCIPFHTLTNLFNLLFSSSSSTLNWLNDGWLLFWSIYKKLIILYRQISGALLVAMVSDSTAEPPQRLLFRTSSSLVKDTPFEKKSPTGQPKTQSL